MAGKAKIIIRKNTTNELFIDGKKVEGAYISEIREYSDSRIAEIEIVLPVSEIEFVDTTKLYPPNNAE